MKLFKRKEKEVEVIKLHKYYANDIEDLGDWEQYYGENYGESWL